MPPDKDKTDNPPDGDSENDKEVQAEQKEESKDNTNKGTLIRDATCVPRKIRFLTDTSLLNEALEKVEERIKSMKKLALFLLCTVLVFAAGSALAVVEIGTREELEAIADNPEENYVLVSDIDLSDGTWTPISEFRGTLDGANHRITGLKIEGEFAQENVGLFGLLSGTVSNLDVNGFFMDIDASGAFVQASVFGLPPEVWNADPRETAAHVINCTVSGNVQMQAESSETSIGMSPLILAQDSNASVNITLTGANMSQKVLWSCTNCSAQGQIQVQLTDTPVGVIAVMQDSVACFGDYTVNVDQNGQQTSSCSVYGILSYVAPDVCEDDILHGSIYHAGYTSVIEGGRYCSSTADVYSDLLVGLRSCENCIVEGTFHNARQLEEVTLQPIIDQEHSQEEEADSDPDSEEEDTVCGNTFDATYEYDIPDRLPEQLNVQAFLGKASVINTPILLDYMMSTNTSVILRAVGENVEPYRHGDISVTTTTGEIIIYSELATEANTTVRSESGEITVTAASSNSGEVTGESGNNVTLIGGQKYNSGSVTATSGNGYTPTAEGVLLEGAYNTGSITAIGNGDSIPHAVGAVGENAWNMGTILSVNNGDGDATAMGSKLGVNYGDVTARSSKGNATAFGIDRGIENHGLITAEGTGFLMHSAGVGNGVGTNYGHVVATNHSTEYGSVANAFGQGGTAYASGMFACGEGSSATAHSTRSGQTSTNGAYCWMMVHHSKEVHDCAASYYRVTYSSNSLDDRYHSWGLMAYTVIHGTSSGSESPIDAPSMPEEETGDDGSAKVSMSFYSSITEKPVHAFTYAMGSYMFSDGENTDYRKVRMEITVKNIGETEKSWEFEVKLPDGFSFEENTILDHKSVSLTLASGASSIVPYTVYPIYTAEKPRAVKVTLTGDLKRTLSVPVSSVENPGRILCRPTEGVNPDYYHPVEVDVDFDPVRDLADCSLSEYNQRLAMLTCALSQAVYNQNHHENDSSAYIEQSLRNAGFSCIAWHPNVSGSSVASAIAQKKVIVGQEIKTVLLVCIRGTVGIEWVGNFLVDYTKGAQYHADFRNAADNVLNRIYTYCSQYGIDSATTRAVLTGHSRGAAVTDLVAHDMNTAAPWNGLVSELVAYTYAAPSCTTSPSADGNIFNYIYAYDVVGFVPYQGFGKYGKNYYVGLPGRNAPAEVKNAFYKYTNYVEYENVGNNLGIELITAVPSGLLSIMDSKLADVIANWVFEAPNLAYGIGTSIPAGDSGIARAHSCENYLAWVFNAGLSNTMTPQAIIADAMDHNDALFDGIALLSYEVLGPVITPLAVLTRHAGRQQIAAALAATAAKTEGGSYFLGYMCPVNVEILDSEGNVVGSYANHEIVQDSSEIFMLTEDEGDFMVIPTGKELTIRVTGNAAGTMEIMMARYQEGENGIEITQANAFEGIRIEEGTVYEMHLDEQGNAYGFDFPETEDFELAFTEWTDTDEHVVHSVAFEENDTVFTDGWMTSAEIKDYETIRELLGTEPEWNVELISGEIASDTWYFDTSAPWRCELFMNAMPENPVTAVYRVTCCWGGQEISALKTIDFQNVTLPTGSDIPEVMELQVGHEEAFVFHMDPPDYPAYNPRICYWLEGMEFSDVFDVPAVGGETGHEITLKPKEGTEGIYSGGIYITSGHIAVGHQSMLFYIADEEGNVPELPLRLSSYQDLDTFVYALFEENPDIGLTHQSWIRNYKIEVSDYAVLQQTLGGEPEWSVEILGDAQDVTLDWRTWDGNPAGFDVFVQSYPNAPCTVTYRVTCQWGNLTVSRDTNLEFVIPQSLPTGSTIPDRIDLQLGNEAEIGYEFQPEGYTFGNADRILFRFRDYVEADLWDSSEFGHSIRIRPYQAGIHPATVGVIAGNIMIQKDVLVYVSDEEGNMPVIGEGSTLILPLSVGEIEDEAFSGSAAEKVIIPNETTRIGSKAFAYMQNLMEIQLPSDISWIEDDAFEGCSHLTFICERESYAWNWALDHGFSVSE